MVDSSGKPTLRVDAVWDIETADWDTYVVGALWTPAGGTELFRNEDDLARALLALPRGSVAWAHAGGRFDVLWLLDWCHRHDCLPKATISMSGPSISAVHIAGGPVLRDSYRLIPMSLKKASTIFPGGAVKGDLALPCVCGRACGGYCSISRKMDAASWAQVEAYLAADVESLAFTLLGLADYAASHQLVLRGTVAGSSWASARLHGELPDAEWSLRSYRIARRGYYGGRVEVRRTRAPRIWRYDRNASYPAALREPVPCGYSRLIPDPKRAKMVWDRARPGFYTVAIDVPDMLAPPLPMRVAERRAYPFGTLRGTWPRDEILHAIDCGAKLRGVHSALIWEREEPVLRPYVEYVWRLRAAATAEAHARGEEESRLAQWLKWLANSLTGAFAQDPEQSIFAIGDKADDAGWKSVGLHDWLWRRVVFRIPDRAHVQWAGVLTGSARVELHRQIQHAGDAWVYSDTDSVPATRPLTRNVGGELGDWKFEGEGWAWEAVAPKVYRYETTDPKTGRDKVVARAKGVPDAERVWPQLAGGQRVVIDRGVKSFLTAVRAGGPLFKRNHTTRQLAPATEWVGARLRDGESATRAPSVDELKLLPR